MNWMDWMSILSWKKMHDEDSRKVGAVELASVVAGSSCAPFWWGFADDQLGIWLRRAPRNILG